MNVIAILKKLGCKVTSRETTPGAQKWWLRYPRLSLSLIDARRKIMAALNLQGSVLSPFPYEGLGFELSFQTEECDGHSGIFIAKPRKTKAGREYRIGLDT